MFLAALLFASQSAMSLEKPEYTVLYKDGDIEYRQYQPYIVSESVVVEHNGDVFCCDFFVEEQFRMGNIMETPIGELAASKMKRQFSRKKQSIDNKCLICRHLDICRGGCMKDRNAFGRGFKQTSYFCESYKMFYNHALPKFKEIAANFQRQNPM